MPSQFAFARKMRIKQAFLLVVHVRCFVPVVLCSVPLSLSFFVSLSFSFNVESGGVAGRERRRRITGLERRWQGGSGQTRRVASTSRSGQTRKECSQGGQMVRREMLQTFPTPRDWLPQIFFVETQWAEVFLVSLHPSKPLQLDLPSTSILITSNSGLLVSTGNSAIPHHQSAS